MELQEFIDNHFEDGEVYSEVGGIEFKRVHHEEYTEHKTVTSTEVYHLLGTEDYFEITTDSDICGYWGDGESYEPTVCKVKPKEVTRIVYVAA